MNFAPKGEANQSRQYVWGLVLVLAVSFGSHHAKNLISEDNLMLFFLVSVILAALAIQQAGSTDRTKVRDALRTIANPPGEPVGPGDWAKAIELIKAGKDIDYTGATGSMDFDDKGDVAGVIGHFVVDGTGYKEVGLVTP